MSANGLVSQTTLLFAVLSQQVARVATMIVRQQDSLLIEIAVSSLPNLQSEMAGVLETSELAGVLGEYIGVLFGLASVMVNLEQNGFDAAVVIANSLSASNNISLAFLENTLKGTLSSNEAGVFKETAVLLERLPSKVAELARLLGQVTRLSNEVNVLELLSRHSRSFLLYTAHTSTTQHLFTKLYSVDTNQVQANDAKEFVRNATKKADGLLRESLECLLAIVPELGLE
jgi:hypothetical protein